MIEKENIADNEPLNRQLPVKTPQQINKLKKRLEYLVQKSIDVFAILSSDGSIKYIGETIEKVYDVKPKELIGKNIFKDLAGYKSAKLIAMLNFVLAGYGREAQGDVALKTPRGREIHLDVHMQNMLHDPAVEGITVNFRDVTDRVALEKEITYMATHHEISGLPNSVYFKKKLRQQHQMAQKNGTKFALMMLEIDGLKYVDYYLGYEFEKPLLKEVVWRLKQCLGDDIFIGHYSGDHFALIVPEPGTNLKYEDIAKQIIASFARQFQVGRYGIDLSVNIGICVYPNEQDVDALGKQAKIALLHAKKEGKNTYQFYTSDLDIQHYKEFLLRNDLHHAIEKEQLKVYFQPMVNLQTNEILAAEALIRWQHPDWGMISAGEFVYLAEETGLIVDLGKWVLREVCRLYRQWQQAGLPDIKVSVNYSAAQFLEKNFVNDVIDIIKEFKLDPRFLIIEITESILIKNTERIASKIQSLQSYGIEVALDDFGAGFSSLAYLNQFYIDILKIDGSFIKKLISNQASVVIVSTLIRLAKELKIKMVAEGIENEEQLSLLKDLNCHYGQGHVYGKPEPAEHFAQKLSKCKTKLMLTMAV